jgi:hypothetical protein
MAELLEGTNMNEHGQRGRQCDITNIELDRLPLALKLPIPRSNGIGTPSSL